MKSFLLSIIFTLSVCSIMAQGKEPKPSVPDSSKEVLIVEAACGQCRLEMPGNSCDLAIRIKNKAYFVDGTDIDSHGDAHAKDGFCNSIRKAKVQGQIINNRFKATYFQLLPEEPKKNDK